MSQLPMMLDSGYDIYLKSIWFLPFIYLGIFRFSTYLSKSLWILYLGTASIAVYCAICESVTGNHYLNIDVYNMAVSMMIAMISYSVYLNYNSENLLRNVAFMSMCGSMILCYIIYTMYFTDYDIMSNIYAFKAKNSMGQILLNCSIIIALFLKTDNILIKYLKYFSIANITVLLFLLKSRATLVSFFFLVFYMVVQSKSKKIRWMTFGVLLLFVVYVLRNPHAYDVVVNGILFAGRDVNDINELSSERMVTFSEAVDIISSNMWFGIGNKYLDSMPVAMVLQFGIVGASIVFSYIFKIYETIKSYNRQINIHLATYLLFITMLLNSLFEAQPPFGPGVKCFMLWIMIGISMACNDRGKLHVVLLDETKAE